MKIQNCNPLPVGNIRKLSFFVAVYSPGARDGLASCEKVYSNRRKHRVGRRHGAPGPALAGRVHISIRRRAVPPLHGYVSAGGLSPAAAGHDRVRAGGRNGASEPFAAGPGAGADGHRGGASAAGLRPVPADGGGKRPSGPDALPGGGPAAGTAAAGALPAGGGQSAVFPARCRGRGPRCRPPHRPGGDGLHPGPAVRRSGPGPDLGRQLLPGAPAGPAGGRAGGAAEARLGGGVGLTVEPPLLLHGPDGGETEDVRRAYFRDKEE